MTNPVPRITQDKLDEAYFLGLMAKTEGQETFRYNVGAFLTAIRSVKDLLIKDIATGKPGAEQHIENAMCADADVKLLIKRRNNNVHDSGLIIMDAEMEEVPPVPIATDPGVQNWLMRRRRRELDQQERSGFQPRSRIVGPPGAVVKVSEPRWFIKSITDRDAYTVCVEHFEKIKKAVEHCVAKFP
jgi:hypothetical protein